MKKDFTIRMASKADLTHIERLMRAAEKSDEPFEKLELIEKHFSAKKPDSLVAVAERTGGLVGINTVFELHRPTAVFGNLFVLPDARGKGVGQALNKFLLKKAFDVRTVKKAWGSFHSVDASQLDKAFEAYREMGFNVDDRGREYSIHRHEFEQRHNRLNGRR